MKEGWQDKFLKALARTGNVTEAARAARVARSYTYEERERNEGFRAQWKDALEESADLLEAEARRRAVTGVLEPVYYQGEEVGKIRRYSDPLLTLLLKANRPEKFRENARIEHTGADGKPIEYIEIGRANTEPSDEAWEPVEI